MKINHVAIVKTVLLIALAATCSFAQKGSEEFQAQAFGEGTQAGHTFNVTVIINEYSTEEDQQVLFDAYKKSGMNGVTNALNKMKTKGRLSITGTLGYDVTYIRQFPSATGRKIRLVTNRPITFGEAWTDSRSQDFNLSALVLYFQLISLPGISQLLFSIQRYTATIPFRQPSRHTMITLRNRSAIPSIAVLLARQAFSKSVCSRSIPYSPWMKKCLIGRPGFQLRQSTSRRAFGMSLDHAS